MSTHSCCCQRRPCFCNCFGDVEFVLIPSTHEVAAREDPDPLDGIPDDIDDDSLDGVEEIEI